MLCKSNTNWERCVFRHRLVFLITVLSPSPSPSYILQTEISCSPDRSKSQSLSIFSPWAVYFWIKPHQSVHLWLISSLCNLFLLKWHHCFDPDASIKFFMFSHFHLANLSHKVPGPTFANLFRPLGGSRVDQFCHQEWKRATVNPFCVKSVF